MMSRSIFIIIALLVPTGVKAQPANCHLIPIALDRLACYDKATPPIKPTPEQLARQKAKSIDEGMREDKRVKDALRPICKNC